MQKSIREPNAPLQVLASKVRLKKYPRGVEQHSHSSGKAHSSQVGGSKSGAVCGKDDFDDGRQQVIAKWRSLPQALGKAILALVQTYS
jgi:hypothetical protein